MSKLRILVVEDSSFMRDMIKRGVRNGFPGFRVDEAINGKQALGLLKKESYDLILCDWEMPEMSGAELLQVIRSSDTMSELPFVMVTSRGDRDHVVKAAELKVSNYIVKPFTNDKLIKVIGTVLTKAKGISIEELRKISGVDPTYRYGNDSVSILTANTSANTTSEPPARKAAETLRPEGKLLTSLRFSNETVTCLIRELSQQSITGVVKRADSIPGILDLAVLDLELEGEHARLNGFVHTLQARENSQESEFINITVNFVDQDDEQKMAFIKRYMVAHQGE